MTTSARNDARRNREKILRTADKAFTDGSEIVTLNEIAQQAGLGRATVYRHFSDRHVLAVALAGHYFDALRKVVDTMDEQCCSFRDLLEWVFSTQISMRPLVLGFLEMSGEEQLRYTEQLIEILTPPFLRAREEGQVRADAVPRDLALIALMFNAAADANSDHGNDGTRLARLVSVFLDGLFAVPAGRSGPSAWQHPNPFTGPTLR